MQERINYFLNRPFPVFLAYRKGRMYYTWMMLAFILLANIIKPFGIINWHEFHKPLVLSNYVVVFFGMYALLYMVLSYFYPYYYAINAWTVRKEFRVLFIFIPVTACTTSLFVVYTVPAFKLTLPAFVQLQFYNVTLSILSIPTFGYFVHTKLNPTKTTPSWNADEQTTSTVPLTEEQALRILQQLHEAMTTDQLYLSSKCTLQEVAEHIGISPRRISNAINNFSAYSFTDFVNKYRVEHACRILQNSKNKRPKLEVIASECGFGSKVNFYQAFKKFTGKTPSEYLASLKNQTKSE